MKRFFKSFRFRLGLVTLLATLVPLVLIGLVTLEMAETYMQRTTVRKHEAVLDAFTSGMQLYLQSRIEQLEGLAQTPTVQSLGPERVDRALNEFLARGDFFTHLFVYDHAGVLRGAASRLRRLSPAKLFGKPVEGLDDPLQRLIAREYRRVLAERRVVSLSGLPRGSEQGVLFLAPIPSFTRPRSAVGFVAAEAIFGGTEIQEVIESYPSRREEYICILDTTGDIVARKGAGLARTADRFVLPDSLAGPRAATTVATVEVENAGRTDLLTLSRCESLGGWIAIGQPARQAFAHIRSMRQNFLVIIILALVLAGGASVYLAWSVTRPMAQLTDGLLKIKEGMLSHRVEATTEDELGEAAQALNTLAETFQKKRVVGSIWETMRTGGPL